MSGFTDIAITWDNTNSRGDFQVTPLGDLLTGQDLMTAILISLFTDRLAEPSDVIPDGTKDRRGWWGDSGETYPIGSRLWLLDREKFAVDSSAAIKNSVQQRAKTYITEALAWMIADGVVAGFDIQTSVTAPSTLAAVIRAYRTLNGETAKGYGWTWSGLVIYPDVVPAQPLGIVTEQGISLVTEDGMVITA